MARGDHPSWRRRPAAPLAPSSAHVGRRIAVSGLLVGSLVPILAAGCGEKSDDAKPVAYIGQRIITKEQLDAAVEHLEEEARWERRTPELGRPGSREARDHLLVVLVYRAELDDGADRLGIHVSERRVEARLARADEDEDEEREDSFARSTAGAQVVYQEIYKRVTRTCARSRQRSTAISEECMSLPDRKRRPVRDC